MLNDYDTIRAHHTKIYSAMEYTKQEIEVYLREYTTLQTVIAYNGNEDLAVIKLDLDNSIRKLHSTNTNLYKTLVGVFVCGNSIQKQAKEMKVSKRQINRRLDDALHLLTLIMNGEVL